MTIRRRRLALLTLPLVAAAALACDDDDATSVLPNATLAASFEEGLGGFTGDATDITDPMVTWSVTQSTEHSAAGDGAARIQFDNVNDQAKVWMEREMDGLQANSTYAVDVSFDFGTADWGDVNLWTLFADADAASPETWADFSDAAQDDTGNGASEDVGFVWLEKSVTLTAQTGADGTLHIAMGIWGTFEASRTYYFDNVVVTATEI